jgi:hypothetical protein
MIMSTSRRRRSVIVTVLVPVLLLVLESGRAQVRGGVGAGALRRDAEPDTIGGTLSPARPFVERSFACLRTDSL